MAQGMDHQWVADLVEVQKIPRYNRGCKYLVTVVDVLSKHGWVQPVKAKTEVELVKAFEAILKSQRKPVQLQTDRGKEFYNQTVQSFLKKNNIHHFSTHGDAKASVVERFNRTLKQRMYRYFTAANTLRYDDVLQSLVRGYNATRHQSIGMAPKNVNWKNERAVWKRLYGSRKKKASPKFKVGDQVRLNKKHCHSKKVIFPAGQRKSLLFEASGEEPCPPTKSRSGMTPPWKEPFTNRIFKKWKPKKMICFASKKY